MLHTYEIVNPVVNRKKPHVDTHGVFIVPNIRKNYKYYIEAAVYNQQTCDKEYFLLLGINNFNDNCRKCRVDDYGRLKVPIKGEVKDYILRESKERGNVDFEYMESSDTFDVYRIN